LVAEETVDIHEVAKEVGFRLLFVRKQFIHCAKTDVEGDRD
jgi:hypothetical protein